MRRVPLFLALLVLSLPLAAQSWRPLGPDGGTFARVIIDAAVPGRLFASNGRPWMSDDGGATWRHILANEHPSIVNAVTDPADHDVIWLADANAVYRSANGGATWTPVFQTYYDGGHEIHSLHLEGSTPLFGTDEGVVGLDAVGRVRSLWAKGASTLFRSPGGTVLVAGSEIWFSTDGGNAWQQTGVAPDGEVVAADGTRLWVKNIYAHTLQRSDDRGAHWTPATLPDRETEQIVADPVTHRLFAATASGLFVSDDGGAWQAMPNAPAGAWSAISVNGNDILGNAAGRLVRTTNGGASWQTADRGLIDGSVWSLAVDPSTAGLFVTALGQKAARHDDAGWGPFAGTLHAWFRSVAFDPSTPRRALAWVEEGQGAWLYESRDGGATWTRRVGLGTSFGSGARFAFDPLQPKTIYLCDAGGYGTAVSHDGGATWSDFVIAESHGVSNIVATPQALYAATPSGLQRSFDRGTTWTAIPLPAITCGGQPSQQWLDAVAAEGSDLVVVNRACDDPYVYRVLASHDAGATWVVSNLHPFALDVIADPTHPGRFFASSRNFVYRSDDGGETWFPVSDGLPRQSIWVTALAFDAARNQLYGGTDGAGVFVLDLDGAPARHRTAH